MNLKSYFKKAQRQKWAIGQFNFSTFEQLRGILLAAQKTNSPVILGTSEGESRYLGIKEAVALAKISKLKYGVDVFLNLDHAKDLNLIKTAIDCGYSMVHFDGSKLSFEKNIFYTKKTVKYACRKGVLVEGELGYLKGASRFHKEKAEIKKEDLTMPEEAVKFVKETKVDALAIVIGNIHGIYSKMPKLNIERLEEIINALKETTPARQEPFLVLHGGSGISNKEIRESIKKGIVKININTELRLVWKETLFSALKSKSVKPYQILPEVQKAVQKKVEEKIKLFGSKNKMD